MRLFEKLKTLNKNEDVYIGSKSAFFYIGKPDDFDKVAYDLDMQWYKNFSNRIKSAQVRLENYKATKPASDMKSVVKKMWNVELGKNVDTELTYEHFLKIWEKQVNEYEKQVEHAKDVLARFKPFNGREVLSTYRNISNTATIIIVEGEESSRFWFYSEYLRYKNGEKIIDDDDEADEETDEDDDTFDEPDGLIEDIDAC